MARLKIDQRLVESQSRKHDDSQDVCSDSFHPFRSLQGMASFHPPENTESWQSVVHHFIEMVALASCALTETRK